MSSEAPLSSALASLLRSKGKTTIQLVDDNAVTPADELIDRALDFEWENRLCTSGGDVFLSTDSIVDEALSIVRNKTTPSDQNCASFKRNIVDQPPKGMLLERHSRQESHHPRQGSNKPRNKKKRKGSGTKQQTTFSVEAHKDTRWEVSPTSIVLLSPTRRLSASGGRSSTLDITHHTREVLSMNIEDMN